MLESEEADLSGMKVLPAPSIKYGTPGVVFVQLPLDHSSGEPIVLRCLYSFSFMQDLSHLQTNQSTKILMSVASETYAAKLEFIVKDCDPETGVCDEEGYPDSYSVRLV